MTIIAISFSPFKGQNTIPNTLDTFLETHPLWLNLAGVQFKTVAHINSN